MIDAVFGSMLLILNEVFALNNYFNVMLSQIRFSNDLKLLRATSFQSKLRKLSPFGIRN